MSNKDFLSQFSDENKKPDSFKEEERVKVTKERKPVNVKLLIIILAIVLAIAGIILFFLLRPTIEVRDFVGSNASDVKAWIKQNDIETQGVIFREEYNFDYDEGYIIYQSVEPNKKIRKNTKMDFTVSLGADPDELISVPNIEAMNKEELQEWVKENKLTKTKIMTAYNSEKEVGEVISYEFKGSDEDSFTRSSSLNITVSKGPQPAGVVVVSDFVGKHYSEVETWGKNNKITINKVTSFSEKVEKDYVISQSIEPKKEVKEGDILTVVVSEGKAVYAKNFVGMTSEELSRWASKNGVYLISEDVYSGAYDEGYVIYQSIPEGQIVKDELNVKVSKGNPRLPMPITEMSYSELKEWIDEVNKKGADITKASHTNKVSDTVAVGNVISIGMYSDIVECGSTIRPVVSQGKNIWLLNSYTDSDGNVYEWSKAVGQDEEYARTLCELAGVSYEVIYENNPSVDAHKVISVRRNCNETDLTSGNSYITQAEVVTVTVCDK